MYKTKLTLEIEIDTQFGPEDAVKLVNYHLQFSAIKIKSIQLINLETDYVPRTSQDINRTVMSGFPIKLT